MRTGAFAERVTVHASQVVAIPKDVPFASRRRCSPAASSPAWVPSSTRRRSRPAPTVVVIGTGGVGLNSVQGAVAVRRALGDRDRSRRRQARGRAPLRRHPHPQPRARRSAGRGAASSPTAAAPTSSSSPSAPKVAVEQSFALLARGGATVIVGMPASGVMASFEPVGLADAGQRVLGSKMGSARIAIDVPMLVDLYRQGRLKLDELVTGPLPAGGDQRRDRRRDQGRGAAQRHRVRR